MEEAMNAARCWTGILALLSCIAPALSAQGVGEIRGKVTSPDGRPLEHAQVLVVGTNHLARADAEGGYRIVGVPSGPRMIRAQQIGYAVERRMVDVPEGSAVTADFALKDAPLSLEAI